MTRNRISLILTLAIILLAGTAAAASLWTFYGGLIEVTGAVDGQVLYSYDNQTWTSGDLTVNKSDPAKNCVYVAFNITSIVGSGGYNFTFYLNDTKLYSTVANIGYSDLPKMIFCTEVLDTELQTGNTYQAKVTVESP